MEIAAIIYFLIAVALIGYMLYDSPIKVGSAQFVILLGVSLVWPLTILLFILDPE